MPEYSYKCGLCGRKAELTHSIHDVTDKYCSRCKRGILIKQPCVPTIIIKGEARELAQVGEKNWDKLGKYGQDKYLYDREQKKETSREAARQKFANVKGYSGAAYKGKRARPFWRPDNDKPLDVTKIKNVQKYIADGTTD